MPRLRLVTENAIRPEILAARAALKEARRQERILVKRILTGELRRLRDAVRRFWSLRDA